MARIPRERTWTGKPPGTSSPLLATPRGIEPRCAGKGCVVNGRPSVKRFGGVGRPAPSAETAPSAFLVRSALLADVSAIVADPSCRLS
jgi:hypothetical protein